MLRFSDFSREAAEPAEAGTFGDALVLVNNRIIVGDHRKKSGQWRSVKNYYWLWGD
jgi:hypothetical protein